MTTFHDFHGSIVYAMEYLNHQRKQRPQEWHSPLLCFGPVYQTDSQRADGAVRKSYKHAQSASVLPYESRTPPLTGAKNFPTTEEAHNIGIASKRRVSKPPWQRPLERCNNTTSTADFPCEEMVGLECLRSLSPSQDQVFGRATGVPILQRTRIDLRVGPPPRSDEE